MDVEIHLLGPPRVVCDGVARRDPRGHKVWGLLAYLLLRDAPPTRAHVAGLLFPAADDPLAALRWALSMLRRLLGEAATAGGDPLRITWEQAPVVDVLAIRAADPAEVASFADLDHDLLEAMAFPGCPSFEIWLEAQRRHARGAAASLLHDAALARLAHGDADGSADLAARLVALDPYDENSQVLLVRSLAVGGRGVDAARQAAACRDLFRTDLGVEPGPALDAALTSSTATPTARAAGGRAAVRALIDAGEAAVGAGALEAGLQCLRRAVADAGALGAGDLGARSAAALGSALVHAARGSDEEGVTSLHRALAGRGAEPHTVAHALGELAYVEFLRGRYDRVEVWLARAAEVTTDPAQQAAALTVRGGALSDVGRYGPALAALHEAFDVAQDERRRAYLLSMVGRVHLLRGEPDAAAVLDESISRASAAGWMSFLPWPQALRAEADLQQRDVDGAAARFEHAFALGCQIGDPCWEGLAARGLGLVHAARDDVDAAVTTLLDARRRAVRLPDGYVWVHAYVLDALATVGVARRLPHAAEWVAELAALAGRCGMAELAARAAVHRWGLGDAAARDAAWALGAAVDNPVLHALLR
jgi:DNA-binding SARP family transcriptional activator